MSFFSSRNSGTPSGVNPDKIDDAIAQLASVTDLFNRMMDSCHAKCIGLRYTEADLNKGESVCVDRCVAKFAEVQKKVEERLRAASGGSGVTEGFGSL